MREFDAPVAISIALKKNLLGKERVTKTSREKAAMPATPSCIQFSALCKTIIDDDSCAFCWHILLLKCLSHCKYNDFGIIIGEVTIIPANV